MLRRLIRQVAVHALLVAAVPAQAFDVNENLSVGVLLAAAEQCQNVSARLPGESYGEILDDTMAPRLLDTAMETFGNTCRGAVPFQLAVSFHPNERNEFFFKFGFAAGNALNTVSPWVLAPWAAYLEDDVKDINGSGRNYLLTAWYKHTFTFGKESSLGASVGILDSTDYLDNNAYANDEYTQFMNEVFVNSGNYGLPSYAPGAAAEWAAGPWSVNAVGIKMPEDDEGNDFNFWGVQAGYHLKSPLGDGNYRVIAAGGSLVLVDPESNITERPFGWGLSFDQAIGKVVGAFLRVAWQAQRAALDYKALYSGGLNFAGHGWGRDADNIGIGYAYLKGGNLDIKDTDVFEAYYRAGLNEYLALTADLQYMSDHRIQVDPLQKNPAGWIFGLRLTAEF
jgi:hypothetical protein